MKTAFFIFSIVLAFQFTTQASVIVQPPGMPYLPPRPPIYNPPPIYVAPVYVPPVYSVPGYVYTCFVQNGYGFTFYGLGYNVLQATQNAQLACNSACVFIGCR